MAATARERSRLRPAQLIHFRNFARKVYCILTIKVYMSIRMKQICSFTIWYSYVDLNWTDGGHEGSVGLIKTINLKVLGGGGGGVDWEEGSVEVGQTRAAMRLYPLPFTNPSPQYPGFEFSYQQSDCHLAVYRPPVFYSTRCRFGSFLNILFHNHYQKRRLVQQIYKRRFSLRAISLSSFDYCILFLEALQFNKHTGYWQYEILPPLIIQCNSCKLSSKLDSLIYSITHLVSFIITIEFCLSLENINCLKLLTKIASWIYNFKLTISWPT